MQAMTMLLLAKIIQRINRYAIMQYKQMFIYQVCQLIGSLKKVQLVNVHSICIFPDYTDLVVEKKVFASKLNCNDDCNSNLHTHTKYSWKVHLILTIGTSIFNMEQPNKAIYYNSNKFHTISYQQKIKLHKQIHTSLGYWMIWRNNQQFKKCTAFLP